MPAVLITLCKKPGEKSTRDNVPYDFTLDIKIKPIVCSSKKIIYQEGPSGTNQTRLYAPETDGALDPLDEDIKRQKPGSAGGESDEILWEGIFLKKMRFKVTVGVEPQTLYANTIIEQFGGAKTLAKLIVSSLDAKILYAFDKFITTLRAKPFLEEKIPEKRDKNGFFDTQSGFFEFDLNDIPFTIKEDNQRLLKLFHTKLQNNILKDLNISSLNDDSLINKVYRTIYSAMVSKYEKLKPTSDFNAEVDFNNHILEELKEVAKKAYDEVLVSSEKSTFNSLAASFF